MAELKTPPTIFPAPEGIRTLLFQGPDYLGKGIPLARITGTGTNGQEAWVEFKAKNPIVKAEFIFTRDNGPWQKRRWEALPAEVAGDRASAKLPEGALTYFFNLIDDRKLIVSSEHGGNDVR